MGTQAKTLVIYLDIFDIMGITNMFGCTTNFITLGNFFCVSEDKVYIPPWVKHQMVMLKDKHDDSPKDLGVPSKIQLDMMQR